MTSIYDTLLGDMSEPKIGQGVLFLENGNKEERNKEEIKAGTIIQIGPSNGDNDNAKLNKGECIVSVVEIGGVRTFLLKLQDCHSVSHCWSKKECFG
jgi:hypothetical protein